MHTHTYTYSVSTPTQIHFQPTKLCANANITPDWSITLVFNNGKKEESTAREKPIRPICYTALKTEKLYKSRVPRCHKSGHLLTKRLYFMVCKKSVILPEWKIKNKTYLRSLTVFLAHVQTVAVWSTGSRGAQRGGQVKGQPSRLQHSLGLKASLGNYFCHKVNPSLS